MSTEYLSIEDSSLLGCYTILTGKQLPAN